MRKGLYVYGKREEFCLRTSELICLQVVLRVEQVGILQMN